MNRINRRIVVIIRGGRETFCRRVCRNPLCSPRRHKRCKFPGVRFADGDVGDQKRVMTPAAAKAIGSDYIVVGRPITAAADPVAAYERCVAEFCD